MLGAEEIDGGVVNRLVGVLCGIIQYAIGEKTHGMVNGKPMHVGACVGIVYLPARRVWSRRACVYVCVVRCRWLDGDSWMERRSTYLAG